MNPDIEITCHYRGQEDHVKIDANLPHANVAFLKGWMCGKNGILPGERVELRDENGVVLAETYPLIQLHRKSVSLWPIMSASER